MKLKKILFGLLALSICCVSCTKDKEEDEAPNINKEDVVATWKITEEPTIDIAITGMPDAKDLIEESIGGLFNKDDEYEFKSNNTCVVTRNISEKTMDYKIEGNKIFNGYIKFVGRFSSNNNKLTLKAGQKECEEILKKELADMGYSPDIINSAVRLLTKGEVTLVLTKKTE